MTTLSASFDTAPGDTLEACHHCGDRCGSGTTRSQGHAFCCAGCESVFALLQAHGLTAYYACAVPPGTSQRGADSRRPSRFAALDDPAVAARLVRTAGASARVTFTVPAIHCASCLWLLDRLWRLEPGVTHVDTSLMNRTVTVEFRPTVTTPRRIAEQLAALGYAPVLDAEPVADRIPQARRRLYLQLGIAGFAFGNMMLFSIPRYVNGAPLEPAFQRLFDTLNVLFALPVLLYSASDYFVSAARAARARTVTLDVPVALGLAVLFGRSLFDIAMSRGEGFLDSFAGLVFFLLIGRLFQRKALDAVSFDRTARSFLPLSVRRVDGDTTTLVSIEQLREGDRLVLRAHEVLPADGVLDDTAGLIDYAFVTGEATPVAVAPGEVVHAGGRVTGGTIRLTVRRTVAHSELARLWTDPLFATPKTHWLDVVLARFGRGFTIAAVLLAVIGAIWWWPDAGRAADVATAVLIIACPCAFTLAAPLTLGTAMGVLGRFGVYVKNPAVVLDLSRITAAVFDKTGTLTQTRSVAAVDFSAVPEQQRSLIRRLAAHSIHPVSRAVAGQELRTVGVTDVREEPGAGISGLVDGYVVALGSAQFIDGITGHRTSDRGHVVWASVGGAQPHAIGLVPDERPGIRRAVAAMSERLVTWLCSGDHAADAPTWAPLFGQRMLYRLTPSEKLDGVRWLRATGHRVLMVGDGLNDAGALAAADVGLAVSDDTACLVPACDAIVRGERLPHVDQVLAYARRARRVIVLAFAVSLFYNAAGLGLALSGRLTPLATAILMPVSSLTIVAISVGLMRRRAPWERGR